MESPHLIFLRNAVRGETVPVVPLRDALHRLDHMLSDLENKSCENS